ncbi:MAG: metallopeptidase family protein [Acidobacteriota bacterium]|nr:metallopeptidase family protein [Acidobacteriota bacterium]MDH3785077.1 metallopeptidase family protein [Acidobacteriota bacterium]
MEQTPDPDLQVVTAIYEALDREQPEAAIRLAEIALSGAGADDPVLRFLAGIAHIELGAAAEAVEHLRRAVELDEEDTEFRANLAHALFASCRFEESQTQCIQVLEQDGHNPDGHMVSGLLLERGGDLNAADDAFAEAHRLDPQGYPLPVRLEAAEFETILELAMTALPESVRGALDEVVVSVEPLPDDEALQADDGTLDPELLGLFVGVPRSESNSSMGPGHAPARILIFKRNLERCFTERAQLGEEIARTLYHELGHYLGLDEDDLEERDLQ